MPFTSWDEPFETEENIGVKGYCTHANCLFPSWHRPYLLLYEAGGPFLANMLSHTDSPCSNKSTRS